MKILKINRLLLILSVTAALVLSIGVISAWTGHEHNYNIYAQEYNDADYCHDCEECGHGGFDLASLNTLTYEETEVYTSAAHINIPVDPLYILNKCSGKGNCIDPNNCSGYAYLGVHYNPYYENGVYNIYYRVDETGLPWYGYTKQEMIRLVDEAAAYWNSVQMHDGTGQIINLQKVDANYAANTGRLVCSVYYRTSGGGNEIANTTIFSNSSGDMVQVSMNIYGLGGGTMRTIMHEFGHLLGLKDLDGANGSGHYVLMGYTGSQMQYQDIQGAALFNLRHTTHTFKRWINSGDSSKPYRHICFFCNGYEDKNTSAMTGSLGEKIANSLTCVHDYQQMVSAGERHWLKCMKCYKVVESEFMLQVVSGSPVTLEIAGLINANKTSITIPNQIGGQNVTKIGDSAFINCLSLESIWIKDGSTTTTIGTSAFSNCSNLEYVSLSYGLVSIGDYAFDSCFNLTKVRAGYNGNINTLPSSVIYVGEGVFYGCDFAYFIIPGSIKDLSKRMFYGCSSLKSVNENLSPCSIILGKVTETSTLSPPKLLNQSSVHCSIVTSFSILFSKSSSSSLTRSFCLSIISVCSSIFSCNFLI